MTDNSLEDWIAARGISTEDAARCELAQTGGADGLISEDVHPSMAYLDEVGAVGAVIPYFNADGSPMLLPDGRRFARMRRLGTFPKDAPKYLQGSGTGVHAYLCPFVPWEEVFANPAQEIVITEGEAKAIALCAQGVPCIALGGVYAFREGATKRFLPELDQCVWQRRTVFICFDSDVMRKVEVRDALMALRTELSVVRFADVREVTLPDIEQGFGPDGKPLPPLKQGLDDFLLTNGFDAFRGLMDQAPSASRLDRAVDKLNQEVMIIDREQNIYDELRDTFYDRGFLINSSRFAHEKIPQVAMGRNGPVERKPISVPEEWTSHKNARRYADIVFRPGQPLVFDTPVGPAYNTFKGLQAAEGDVTRFLELTEFIFSEVEEEHRDFALKLCAYKAQNPGQKIPISLIFVGTMGSGKSLWCEMIQRAFEPHSKMLQPQVLKSDHNNYVERSLFTMFDEISPRQMRESFELLKYLISQPTVQLNEKYRPQKPVDNLGLFVFTTNYPEVASFVKGERRSFVVQAPDKADSPFGEDWYEETFAWLRSETSGARQAIMHYLLNYDLKGWKPPKEAPMTAAKHMAYVEGLDPITSIVEQIQTADRNVVELWIRSAIAWAKDMEANLPPGANAPLRQRIREVQALLPNFPIRPFYSMSELGLIFPALGEQLMGNAVMRNQHYTPEKIATQLRTAGIKTLRNRDNVKGFMYRGRREHFLIIADVNNPAWKKELTQDEFDALIAKFPRFGAVKNGA